MYYPAGLDCTRYGLLSQVLLGIPLLRGRGFVSYVSSHLHLKIFETYFESGDPHPVIWFGLIELEK